MISGVFSKLRLTREIGVTRKQASLYNVDVAISALQRVSRHPMERVINLFVIFSNWRYKWAVRFQSVWVVERRMAHSSEENHTMLAGVV